MSRVFNNKSVTRYRYWYLVTDLLLNTLDIDTYLLIYCWTLLTLIPSYWLIVEHSWHWYLVTDLLLNTLDIDTGLLTYCWTLLTLIPSYWLIVEHSWHWYRVIDLLLNTPDIDTWLLTYCWTHQVSMSRVFNNKSVTRYQCQECSTRSQSPCINVKSVQQ
jgi:hypothetical protein